MPLEGTVRQLLEDVKYRRKFPPRGAAARKKSELTARGLAQSGALIAGVSSLCADAAEGVLDEFSDTVIAKAGALGLTSEGDLRRVMADAHQQLFDEARGFVLGELGVQAGDFWTLAMTTVDNRRESVWRHLERQLELRKLEVAVPITKVKQREQKFGILLSAPQAERDFGDWVVEATTWDNPVAVVFVDLDRFKALNERWTNAAVDGAILPAVQKLLAKLVHGRGDAYRHGGEEFLLIMPNMDVREAETFAERVRETFEQHPFEVERTPQPITVSVGVAIWPDHGGTYQEVLEAANRAELVAKRTRNAVKVAGQPAPRG